MTEEEKDEILNTYKWIKVKRYEIDYKSDKSYRELLEEFEEHHIAETNFLIEKIRELVRQM